MIWFLIYWILCFWLMVEVQIKKQEKLDWKVYIFIFLFSPFLPIFIVFYLIKNIAGADKK